MMKINILEYFEKTVNKFPNKVALEFYDQQETFKSWHKKALNISHEILKIKNIKKKPIGIFLPKCANALITFTGVLYSGNIYTPLDVKTPNSRLEKICKNIDFEFIICDQDNFNLLTKLNIIKENKILIFENLINTNVSINECKTNYQNLIDIDPAYIINTSGSTGTPKGVIVSHRSLIDYIEWLSNEPKLAPSENDIIGNQTPFFFDKSIFDIYLCMKTGAKLVIIPPQKFIFPAVLLEYLNEKKINFIFWVPSIFTNIANYNLLESIKVTTLNKITVSGEIMPTNILNYWRKYYPDAVFANCYGPTEITDICTYYIVNRNFKDDEPLPIGKPCRNIEIILLDENNKVISEPNKIGELCIKGSCLSLQYYNDFARSQQLFQQNPANDKYYELIYRSGDLASYNEYNEIMYNGRKDLQIKYNGYRIELGEIETALGNFKLLKNYCVVFNHKANEIVLFYTGKNEISLRELSKTLSGKLPPYMLPTKLVKLKVLPLNANGKIDRKRLTASLNGEIQNG